MVPEGQAAWVVPTVHRNYRLEVPEGQAAWVVPTVHHNYRLEVPEAATGSTIRHIVAAHPTETAQRPIDLAAQLAATP